MAEQQQPTKMWSGRFREPLDTTFESWQRSFPFDWRLVPYEVEASIAHARAIEAAGILTSEELLQMEEGLRAVAKQQAEQGEAIVTANPQAEDVHHYVELELTKQIGDLALKLHTGRSRNEQIATDMRLFVREAIDSTLDGLNAWREALIDLADHSRRSHHARLHSPPARRTRLRRPLAPRLRRHARARLLPLHRRPQPHELLPARLRCHRGRDSRARSQHRRQRTRLHRSYTTTAWTQPATATSCSISPRPPLRLAFTSPASPKSSPSTPPPSSASSTSPKPSPPAPARCRRRKTPTSPNSPAANPPASSAQPPHSPHLIKGLPLAYNKDLQEGQEQIFDVADTLAGLLSVLPNFTRALTSERSACRSAAETGYLNAMAAATYLSNKGVPFRKAHEIVGNAVRLGLDKNLELNALPLSDLRQLSEHFAEDFFAAISLASHRRLP